jgi:hypothetical protein
MTCPSDSPLSALLVADVIVELQDRLTKSWHQAQGDRKAEPDESPFLEAVAEQHLANFELWHIEDEARTPRTPDRQIAELKRAIDATNQRRNDLMERCDLILMAALEAEGLPRADAELHSESPGLMLDRLSILALKIYHTREEIDRQNAPEGHAGRNRERLAVLEMQRADLAGCLDRLWQQVIAGERRIKVYRQLKMYNDATLNPAVYFHSETK